MQTKKDLTSITENEVKAMSIENIISEFSEMTHKDVSILKKRKKWLVLKKFGRGLGKEIAARVGCSEQNVRNVILYDLYENYKIIQHLNDVFCEKLNIKK